jgi:hypothetical protein
MILLSMILLSASAFGQAMVFSNQVITVAPENLAVESVRFQPLEIVTNNVVSWEPVELVITNGLFSGGEVVISTMQQQVITPVITTNAARWTVGVIFSLPSGHQWSLNGMPVTVERFKTRLEVPVDPAAVTATFGQAAAGLEFAAQHGEYVPTGAVRDAFLSLAAKRLGEGK